MAFSKEDFVAEYKKMCGKEAPNLDLIIAFGDLLEKTYNDGVRDGIKQCACLQGVNTI